MLRSKIKVTSGFDWGYMNEYRYECRRRDINECQINT